MKKKARPAPATLARAEDREISQRPPGPPPPEMYLAILIQTWEQEDH